MCLGKELWRWCFYLFYVFKIDQTERLTPLLRIYHELSSLVSSSFPIKWPSSSETLLLEYCFIVITFFTLLEIFSMEWKWFVTLQIRWEKWNVLLKWGHPFAIVHFWFFFFFTPMFDSPQRSLKWYKYIQNIDISRTVIKQYVILEVIERQKIIFF